MGVTLLVAAILAQSAPAELPAEQSRAVSGASVRGSGGSVDEALRRAVNEYAYGNYEKAIEQLRALLYPMRLVSDAQVIEARKYLALAYQLTDQPQLMTEEFEKLLYLEPDYQLDPFSIPPSIIDQFEAVRARLKQQLDVVRLRRSEQPTDPARPAPLVTHTVVERNELLMLLPFGIGQFENGDEAWGLFFAVAQVVLLGINVGSHLYATYEIGDNYPPEDKGLVRALAVTQYASLGMFGIVWSLGIFHARLNFVPTVTAAPAGRDAGPSSRATTPGAWFTLQF